MLLRILIGVALLVGIGGCESSTNDAEPPAGRVLVLSAFPAELAALLETMSIEDTVQVEGRWFRIGTLGGTPVVVGMTGIGIANAAQASQVAFDAFDVVGAVFSGVAGSYLRIGDVAVPLTWELANGMTFPSDPAWIELARDIVAPGVAELDECTLLPNDPDRGPVCLTVPPVIVVGGRGYSSGFEDQLVGCQPAGGDIFGCDVPDPEGEGQAIDESSFHASAAGTDEPLAAQDMETAAVAREAAARGLPFIGFRAVSDGEGDPLGLPGFPAQFFAYYRLAAHNAAGAATAFLERLAVR